MTEVSPVRSGEQGAAIPSGDGHAAQRITVGAGGHLAQAVVVHRGGPQRAAGSSPEGGAVIAAFLAVGPVAPKPDPRT